MTQTTVAPQRPPAVTDGEYPPPSGHSPDPPPERGQRIDWDDGGPEVASTHPEPATFRDRILVGFSRAKAYWAPPSPLVDPPPSWPQIVAYARHGRWTTSPYHPRGATAKDPHAGKEIRVRSGFLRRLAGVWAHLVFLPAAFVLAYARWILERPGRAVAVYAVWKLVIETGPGPWMADNIIRPVLAFAGWVLL